MNLNYLMRTSINVKHRHAACLKFEDIFFTFLAKLLLSTFAYLIYINNKVCLKKKHCY